jgi:hypothetical protein
MPDDYCGSPDDGTCCNCGGPLFYRAIISDFCSSQCEADFADACRENAEVDALEWGISGPPDTDCIDY